MTGHEAFQTARIKYGPRLLVLTLAGKRPLAALARDVDGGKDRPYGGWDVRGEDGLDGRVAALVDLSAFLDGLPAARYPIYRDSRARGEDRT